MKLRGSALDPLWYKDAIIYETHVKAFFDGNDDGIGDFQGLTRKLDYIQALGVTCLWLLPFFPSPLKDDGYDIADYTSVHPSYGTLDDFKTFLNAAHERGLQVLIELVVNHTSDNHAWFQRARKAPPGSPERDYYVWSDTVEKYSDARIIFTDTEKSNWAWDPEARAYYWHRFFSHQPDLNFDNPAVLQEVIRAMRFWLDLGADGMRLDAIPYLVERAGTNCENLPETHEIIKKIRRALDEGYTHRMFLAEANQWPADVLPYFGDEDECHMAFHFPLMPRIFMALRLEDRHPITEIMAQTPPILPSSQWGLFLRNHDELTLEMVTNDERDYMYLAYSADPRMRINVGIRRRLAPLMENNRLRIELLNSLLFSFPGTPILYYGDEIGMGDNIYLGDRNGVRTPMQWTADRNAGFSRANPAKLYSPVILDPVYGYEAVNVEAQQSDPSSLLHWMRNMIGLRKLFQVFGRGTLEFLTPENRKVLAYIRKYATEQVLCVANLSRFSQPVELDLSALAGMRPVEMLGFTEFPQIAKSPYRLTLGPYAFFWFELQGTPEPVEIRSPGSHMLLRKPEEIFDTRPRRALELDLLPAFLPKQRWYAGKARTLERVAILDWIPIQSSPWAALVLMEVTYRSGETEVYDVPLAISNGRAADDLLDAHPDAVLARLRLADSDAVLHDAMADDAACIALLEAIAKHERWKGENGAAEASPVGPRCEDTSVKVTRSGAEQSNTSIIFGGKLILKLFRRVQEGPNPDFEMGRFLTERAGFANVPAVAGGIEYRSSHGSRSTLAMLQQFVPHQGDGWTITLDELGRFYEHASLHPGPPKHAADSLIGIYLDYAAALGKRTAELHLALSMPSGDPAFEPEPATLEFLTGLAARLRSQASTSLRALRATLPQVSEDSVDQAAQVLTQRAAILSRLQVVEQSDIECMRIRIHGDYHLGQVLRVENDFVIFDFEGEPSRPIGERSQKQLALKDVAGMLRSFSYAAYAALLAHTTRRLEEYDRLAPWAAFWEKSTCAAFLKSYLATANGAPFLPRSARHREALLGALLLDKALYELDYELNNRPTWARIPLTGILNLVRS